LHIRCQSLEAARAILGIEDICNDNNRFIPCTEHGENWKTHSLNGPMQLLIMHTHTRCLSCPPSAHSSVTALRPRQHPSRLGATSRRARLHPSQHLATHRNTFRQQKKWFINCSKESVQFSFSEGFF
jgi:hypothetical protein